MHLRTWLRSLLGKSFEIASDVLRFLSDSSKGDSPTDRQPGSSNPRRPSDQLLDRGPGDGITVPDDTLGTRVVFSNQLLHL